MICKCCPAFWQDVTPMVGIEDWGCHCEPENGNDCGYEIEDGVYGCDRTIDSIKTQLDYMLDLEVLTDYAREQVKEILNKLNNSNKEK